MENITLIKDTKFKNIVISVRFLFPLKKEAVLVNQLLSAILHESCKQYPDKYSVTKQLDTMYGASYSCACNVIGNMQEIVCKCKIINPSYVKDFDLLKEAFALLHAFIFSSRMDCEDFDDTLFEEAKRNVKDMILRSEEDPSTLCLYEAMRVSGDAFSLAKSVQHSASDVDLISKKDVYNAYINLLHNAYPHVLVVGDFEDAIVKQYIQTYLPLKKNTFEHPSYSVVNTLDTQLFETEKDITQSYITNFYTTKINNTDTSYMALKLANVILGQLPTSLLFQEIREKRSLCYSIYSSLLPYDGILAITTGVEVNTEKEVLHLIEEQIQNMKEGNFKDELIDTAKKMMVSSIHSTNDSIESMIGFSYQNVLLNKNDTLDDLICSLNKISKEDVIKVMQDCEILLSYVLKGKNVYEESV